MITTINNSFRKLSADATIYDRDTWHVSDKPKQTSSTAVLLRFGRNKILNHTLGFQVSDKGFRSENFNVNENIVNHSYTIQKQATYRIDYGFRFYDLIYAINIKHQYKRIRAGIEAGFTLGLGIGDRLINKTSDRTNHTFYLTKREPGMSFITFPRLDYLISSKFSLGLVGHFRYSPIKFNNMYLLYGSGIGFSLSYSI